MPSMLNNYTCFTLPQRTAPFAVATCANEINVANAANPAAKNLVPRM